MRKKLSRHGNSLAVIIDKPILELLDIDEKTTLKIRTDGYNIIIEPVKKMDALDKNPRLKKSYEKVVEKYGADLKKLAKN